jgi:hypothetical protein
VTKRIFLGPELVRFEAMAGTAERLAQLGAGVVIVLLLITARDLIRRD